MIKANRALLETVPETDVLPCCNDNPTQAGEVKNEDNMKELLVEALLTCQRKLRLTENKLKSVSDLRDQQLKTIVSKLLLLEGKLIRDKKVITQELEEKDAMIEDLQAKLMGQQGLHHWASSDGLDDAEAMQSDSGNSLQTFLQPLRKESSKKHSRAERDIKCYSSPALCDAESQTEGSSEPRKSQPKLMPVYLEPITKEMRSYSNPGDPEEAYEKTSEIKVKDKDKVVISVQETPESDCQLKDPIDALPKLVTRKKSLSSPDLHQLLANNPPSETASREVSRGLHSLNSPGRASAEYLDEVDQSIALHLASPRPSLPDATIPGLFALQQKHSSTLEYDEQSSETMSPLESPNTPICFSFDPAPPEEKQPAFQGSNQKNKPSPRMRKDAMIVQKFFLRSHSMPNTAKVFESEPLTN